MTEITAISDSTFVWVPGGFDLGPWKVRVKDLSQRGSLIRTAEAIVSAQKERKILGEVGFSDLVDHPISLREMTRNLGVSPRKADAILTELVAIGAFEEIDLGQVPGIECRILTPVIEF